MTLLVQAGSLLAVIMALHAAVNLRFLRRLDAQAPPVGERVSVLVPARNEERHIAVTVASLLAQTGVPDLEVIVLDDGSTDGTAALLAGFSDARLRVVHAPDALPPEGWLGKPWACERLSRLATGSVLVFVDADVEASPEAVGAAVAALRAGGFAMVAPEPREVAGTALERLVQPLLGWAIATAMPVWLASRTLWPSLSAANGQFLVFDAAHYRAFGGHGAVRHQVIEDISIMRACKQAGGRAATLDGSRLVRCRMYEDARALVDGYTKSAWDAFGGPLGSLGVVASLLLAGVVPLAAMVLSTDPGLRLVGGAGYLAAVSSRVLAGRRFGDRVWPDALAHPLSMLAFAALNAESWRRHLLGANRWKGRPVRV